MEANGKDDIQIVRRFTMVGLLCCVIGRNAILPSYAEEPTMSTRESLIKLEKTIGVAGGIHIEWSPDGRYLAFLSPDFVVRIVDVVTGNVRAIEIPKSENFTAITALAWSREGTRLAISNRNKLIIVSAETLQIVAKAERGDRYRLEGPMAFGNDDDTILLQCVDGKGPLIVRLDLRTLEFTSEIAEARVGDATAHAKAGRFQRIGDNLYFGAIVSPPVSAEDRRPNPTHSLWANAKFRCHFFSVLPKPGDVYQFDLPNTSEKGVDDSGINRMPPIDCLMSPESERAVVFSGWAGRIPSMAIDESKDKSFLVYDVGSGQRVAGFGGYGAPETNWITQYDVHPGRSWAITIARKAPGPSGQTVGLITIWDLRTGSAMQRVEIAEGPLDVKLSQDGTRLAVTGRQMLIFAIN